MDRHRHDPQGGAGEHHHRARSGAGQLGEVFGVPGMPEAGTIERVLVDREGHHGGGATAAHRGDRGVDRADHQRRIGGIGAARLGTRHSRRSAAPAAPRRRSPGRRAGAASGLTLTSQPRCRASAGEAAGVVDHIKWGHALAAPQPRLERNLAADPGRLAHCQGERKRHVLTPSHRHRRCAAGRANSSAPRYRGAD